MVSGSLPEYYLCWRLALIPKSLGGPPVDRYRRNGPPRWYVLEKYCCAVIANATCLTVSDRRPQYSPRKWATAFIRSFVHQTVDRTIWLNSSPNFKGEYPGGGQGIPPLFPFH
ncbi:hypothetical protein TNCV_4602511 [Trichonephila clavipes]|nr:hypothetical protein TNCV_4602511 [Trichonephila clavipes]